MVRRENTPMFDPSLDGSFGVMMAAHELKSPSALIRQLALELQGISTDAKARQLVDQILLTSERSLRLTSNLTKTARLSEGLFELEPINARQICEEIAHEITPLYKSHGKEIMVSTRRSSQLVIANRELLRRVLLGFADNALYYGDTASKVAFGIERRANKVQIGLRDKGPVLPRARSIQPILTGRPSASGLGLVIADKFATVMQSNIGMTRHRDGMTFYISMTASEQLALL